VQHCIAVFSSVFDAREIDSFKTFSEAKKSPRTHSHGSSGTWGDCCQTVLELFRHRTERHSRVIDFENERCGTVHNVVSDIK
jgi:hypothetical protein